MRAFRLQPCGQGIACDAGGASVGPVALLKRVRKNGKERWAPRNARALSIELSKHCGLPIDASSKAVGLATVAKALNDGQVARAQIATLFLQFPERLDLAASPSRADIFKFVGQLCECGLIKADWDPDEHPRWPALSPDRQGGRFAPKGNNSNSPTTVPKTNRPGTPTPAAAAQPGSLVPISDKHPVRQRSWEEVARETQPPPIDTPFIGAGPFSIELDLDELAAEEFSLLRPGPFARESVPATGPSASAAERAEINRIGNLRGCHSCGTKSPGTAKGNWIPDHQPPTSVSPSGAPQELYPQCLTCSNRQGGQVGKLLRLLRRKSEDNYGKNVGASKFALFHLGPHARI